MEQLREWRASVLPGASRRRILNAALVAAALTACQGRGEPPAEVPVYPGATERPSEGSFQSRLLALFGPPGSSPPRVLVYATPAAFTAVADFYGRFFTPGSGTQQRFAVASRMRDLAAGVRAGGSQQLAVGRLLFARGAPPDSLAPEAVADSLVALADRLQSVEGLISLGRISLASTPPSEALVSIERPHWSAETLSVDSATVVTVVVRPVPAASP
jgi:hypothetical protein